jgi:squalene monooxygenase
MQDTISPRDEASKKAPRPAWEWFAVSNALALVAGGLGVRSLLAVWAPSEGLAALSALARESGDVAIALAGIVIAILYFVAFFGVIFIRLGLDEGGEALPPAPAAKASELPARHGEPSAPLARGADADVVIVGWGLAGAALATVLARQGKRVLVLERCAAGRREIRRGWDGQLDQKEETGAQFDVRFPSLSWRFFPFLAARIARCTTTSGRHATPSLPHSTLLFSPHLSLLAPALPPHRSREL